MNGKQPALWLVRHGETDWSSSGRHTGRTDISLNEEGRARAELAAPVLTRREFALVMSSPLKRARETCALAGYGERAVLEPDLREWDYGEYEGKTTADIRMAEPDWSIWSAAIQEGESLTDVSLRADRVIEKAMHASGDVLMFAHGHVLRILAARWLALPGHAGQIFALSTASLSILGYERENRVMLLWNRSLSE